MGSNLYLRLIYEKTLHSIAAKREPRSRASAPIPKSNMAALYPRL
ncbi:MAG: hypothetical protein ACUVTL_00745 [Thermoproteota archaeon]